MTSYDAMDYRTVLGGGHYRTNVFGGIKMAELDGVTDNDSEGRPEHECE